MQQELPRRKNRKSIGDLYRLIFAACGWALFTVIIFVPSSYLSRNRPAAYGMGCLLAAYTLLVFAIWRKSSR